MSSSIFRIAVSGMQAAQAGIATTSHNIANVNTPGYSRQAAMQSNSPGQFTGSGYFGRGVTVDTILRRYDSLLVAQERLSAGAQAHQSTLNAQAAAIDQVLGDTQTGLSDALSGYFTALDTLAAQPGDAAARQSAVSAAAALAGRMRSLDSALQMRSQGIDQRIETTVGSVNELTRQVADVNRRISLATAGGHVPNDLMDLRDRLIGDLNQLAQVSSAIQSDGAANLYLSNGQALVVGEQAYALRAAPDAFDGSRRVVGLDTLGGFMQFGADTLVGGELGGLLAARRDVVDPAIDRLGQIAMTLASAANAQHRLGVDRNGLPGGDLFAVATPWISAATDNAGSAQLAATLTSATALTGSEYQVTRTASGWDVVRTSDGNTQSFATLPATLDGVSIALHSGAASTGDRFLLRPTRDGAAAFSALVTDPNRLAAGAAMRSTASTANTGTGAISSGTVTTAGPSLAQTVTITFTSPTTFDVSGTGTGNPTGLAYTAGMTIAYNGWSATLTGLPAAGDTFTMSANAAGVGDNRNAQALAALQSAKLTGGTSTLAEAYGSLVAYVGSATHESGIAAQAQGAMRAEAHAAVQSVSGVNLDEEAANLMRYQQAYQASAKVIAAADAMFQSLLEVTR